VSAGVRVAVLVIAALLVPALDGTTSRPAFAQVWRPEKRKPAPAPKPPAKPRRKKKPPAPKPAPPPSEPADDGDGGDDADATATPPDDTPVDGDDGGEEETIGDDDDGDDDGGDGQSIRIDDDLDDGGAKVTFTDSDLASDAAGAKGVTRLETLAMAFFRLGVDTVHDAVPVTPANVKAIGEDTLSFRAHGRAEGIGRFGPRVKIKAAGRFNADLGLDADTHIGVERYEGEVWDTYADYYAPHLDTRVGKQILAWGVNDLLSPNDVINARDLRRGFLERPDELRLPVLALSSIAYDGPFYFQGVYVPVAPTNRFELLEGDYALLGPNAATPTERRVGAILATLADDPTTALQIRPLLDIGARPDNGIDSGELGARLALRFRRLDVAGCFLWGHERGPRYQLHPDLIQLLVNTPPDMVTPELLAGAVAQLAMNGQSPVSVDYPRRTHVGGSIATRIEPFGFKAEAAYAFEGNTMVVPPGGGPLLGTPMALPQVSVAASVDYDRGSDFTVILEAGRYQVLDVPSGLDVFQLQHDHLDLVAGRLEWTPFAGPVTLRFLGFLDVGSPSYAIAPALRFSGHDNLSLEIAANLYGGPQGSFGGIADDNDEVLFTVQYGL